MVVAMTALGVALSGSGIAAGLVASAQIKDGTIRLVDINPSTKEALEGQRGTVGPRGATGATGVTGAQGPAGPVAVVPARATNDQFMAAVFPGATVELTAYEFDYRSSCGETWQDKGRPVSAISGSGNITDRP